jgi:hypothetical protein
MYSLLFPLSRLRIMRSSCANPIDHYRFQKFLLTTWHSELQDKLFVLFKVLTFLPDSQWNSAVTAKNIPNN